MSTVREQAIAKLKTVLKTASVKTVVVANGPLDLTTYSASQLPLVEIIPGVETALYEVGRHAEWRFQLRSTVYFVESRSDEAQQEKLVGEQKNALGGNPTLDDIVEIVDIVNVTPGGSFPLYSVEFQLSCRYERHIANA